MRCPNCVNDNRSGAKFCHFCGQTLPADKSVTASPLPIPNQLELETISPRDDYPSLVEPSTSPTMVPPPLRAPAGEDTYTTLIVKPENLFAPMPIAASLVGQTESEPPESEIVPET